MTSHLKKKADVCGYLWFLEASCACGGMVLPQSLSPRNLPPGFCSGKGAAGPHIALFMPCRE